MAAGAHAAAGQVLTALSKAHGRRRGSAGGPCARASRTRYRWPRVAADLACQAVPRALADTLPGPGPAGLARARPAGIGASRPAWMPCSKALHRRYIPGDARGPFRRMPY